MVMGALFDISLDAVEWGVKTLKRRRPSVEIVHDDFGLEESSALPAAAPPLPPAPPEEIVQWGLKLPNQNIVWDNALYCGLPLGTGEERGVLTGGLRKTAQDMGFDVSQFLAGFAWVRRIGVPGVVWSDATLIPLVGEDPETPDNDADQYASEYLEQNDA